MKLSLNQLAEERSKHLARNIQTALRVAIVHPSEDGRFDFSHMSKTELAELSGLTRSTVTTLVSEGGGAKRSNPDLNTLCRTAEALGTSPAYLLMSSEDWAALAVAATILVSAQQDGALRDFEHSFDSPEQIARGVLEMIRRAKITAHAESPDGSDDRNEVRTTELERLRSKAAGVNGAIAAASQPSKTRMATAFIGAAIGLSFFNKGAGRKA